MRTTGGATPTTPPTAAPPEPSTLVAAGDIACPAALAPSTSECQQAATAELVRSIAPDTVLALGDLQYPDGSTTEFAAS